LPSGTLSIHPILYRLNLQHTRLHSVSMWLGPNPA
jgi:hypothetical protein